MTMKKTRRDDNWIQTYTGRRFWPLDPRPEDIDILDIAHALALKCRYTGHCREFYSIGQHSVLASLIVGEADMLGALMHDASEAYLADVARPVKHELPDFLRAEERLEKVIAERFALPWPMSDSIKRADLILLRTERRDLMGNPPLPCRTDELCRPMVDTITPWNWEKSEIRFLERYQEITSE